MYLSYIYPRNKGLAALSIYISTHYPIHLYLPTHSLCTCGDHGYCNVGVHGKDCSALQ